MANRRLSRRGCYNAEDAFRILMEDIDSDEEDFEELKIAGVEPDEEELSNAAHEEDNTEDENLTSEFHGNDGSIWRHESRASSTGRTPRKNIVQIPGGAKRFILARANNPIDVFFELWGQPRLLSSEKKTSRKRGFKKTTIFL